MHLPSDGWKRDAAWFGLYIGIAALLYGLMALIHAPDDHSIRSGIAGGLAFVVAFRLVPPSQGGARAKRR